MKKTYREAFLSDRRLNSDKYDHYFDIYDHLFGHLYDQDITYVEIGVQNGGSLETTSKLFGKNSTIIGVDIDPRCKLLEEKGLAQKIIIGSQTDQLCLGEIRSSAPAIDILIDDGSHVQYDMIATFIELFPIIKDNGIYIIEDTHTNYSPQHQNSFFGLGLYDYFKGLSERLNLDFIDPELRKHRYKIPREERPHIQKSEDVCNHVFSIEFFDSVIAIRKKRKLEPLRIRR
jgi:hypothetical protein